MIAINRGNGGQATTAGEGSEEGGDGGGGGGKGTTTLCMSVLGLPQLMNGSEEPAVQ